MMPMHTASLTDSPLERLRQSTVKWRSQLVAGDPERLFYVAVWVTALMAGILATMTQSGPLLMVHVVCSVVPLLLLGLCRWRPQWRMVAVWTLWILVQASITISVTLQGGVWTSVMGYYFVCNTGMLIVISLRAVLVSASFTVLVTLILGASEFVGALPLRTISPDDNLWWLVLFLVEFAGFNVATMVVYRIQDAQSLNLKSNNQALAETHEKLRKQHRMQEQFVASVSHELRTPMNAILGFLQTIDRDERVPRQERELLDYMEQSAYQLLSRIEELLDFSQLQAGRLQVRPRAFDLGKALQGVVEGFDKELKEKPFDLVLEVSPSVPAWVMGDAERIEQILRILVGNAIKFTAQGAVVLRVHRERPDWLTFAVIDTGLGIAPSELDRIFNRLSLITSRTRREMGGTGLGLSITKGLVELMRGDLSVRSQEGAGSTFTVRLPLREAAPIDEPEHLATDLAEGAALRARVLLVDDAPVNRLVAQNLLRAEFPHLEIDEARDGHEALTMLRSQSYDLVLMDVFMPTLSGIDAARQLREAALPHAPSVIALTADVSDEITQACLSAGMSSVVHKPFGRQALARAVVRALAARRVAVPDSSPHLRA